MILTAFAVPALGKELPIQSPFYLPLVFSDLNVLYIGTPPRIVTLRADGSESEPTPIGARLGVAWSPDGSLLAFDFVTGDRFVGFTPHIGLMAPDGSFYTEVVSPGVDPAWSPLITVP